MIELGLADDKADPEKFPLPLHHCGSGCAQGSEALAYSTLCARPRFESLTNFAAAAPVRNTFIHFADVGTTVSRRHRTCPWDLARTSEAADVARGEWHDVPWKSAKSETSDASTDDASKYGCGSEAEVVSSQEDHCTKAGCTHRRVADHTFQEASRSPHLEHLRRRGADIMSRLRLPLPAATLISRLGMEAPATSVEPRVSHRCERATVHFPPLPPPPLAPPLLRAAPVAPRCLFAPLRWPRDAGAFQHWGRRPVVAPR